MESLGEFLKAAREEKDVSLEEISNRTRINLKVLRALEDDVQENLPGDIFVRGFLKAYAHYLDIDSVELLSRYESSHRTEENPIDEYKLEVIEDFFEKKSKKPIIYLILALIVVALIYHYYNSNIATEGKVAPKAKKSEDVKTEKLATDVFKFEDKSANEKVQIKAPAAKQKKPKLKVEKAAVKPPPVKKPREAGRPVKEKRAYRPPLVAETAAAGEKRGHDLTFRSDGIVWMQITIDEEPPYEVTLKEDEVYKVKANDKFTIKIGDAGKVRVELDGKDLGYLGKEKQVRTITLPETKE